MGKRKKKKMKKRKKKEGIEVLLPSSPSSRNETIPIVCGEHPSSAKRYIFLYTRVLQELMNQKRNEIVRAERSKNTRKRYSRAPEKRERY